MFFVLLGVAAVVHGLERATTLARELELKKANQGKTIIKMVVAAEDVKVFQYLDHVCPAVHRSIVEIQEIQ